MSNSRTKNSAINATVAMVSKIIYMVLSFICRTIFIKTLGTEYLGVNGLFTNILTILSFAELGIGSAIIFKLYKPIADENKERVKTLVHFYKRAYYIIGLFILIAGISVIPVLKFIVKDAPNIKENISGIYVLFLVNTAISYFFTHKKSIITGHQKEYILNLITLVVTIIQNILQIIFLLLTHNYIIYLLLQIGGTILDNVIAGVFANKMYPYIKEKNYTKINKAEQRNIFNDVKSLVLYKLGYVISNGTDNIIISSSLGVSMVGLLSNYTTIITAITTLVSSAFTSITASIGNLNTIKERKRKEEVFYETLLISFLVYGYVSIAVVLLINRFITIWLGAEYLLGIDICFALGFNLYIDGVRFVNYTFRNTLGLFKKGRLMPLFSSFTNVVLSLILVQYIGMFGVLIATGLTRLCILTWYDPYIIHKSEFKTSSKRYYKTYAYYLIIAGITFIICYEIMKYVSISGIFGFIVSGIVITVVVAIIFIISTFRLKEFKGIRDRIIKLTKNKNKE